MLCCSLSYPSFAHLQYDNHLLDVIKCAIIRWITQQLKSIAKLLIHNRHLHILRNFRSKFSKKQYKTMIIMLVKYWKKMSGIKHTPKNKRKYTHLALIYAWQKQFSFLKDKSYKILSLHTWIRDETQLYCKVFFFLNIF